MPKVLVVDDEPDITRLVKFTLERKNFEVYTADNGENALSIASQERPDLILLDVTMPVLDGYETCRRLKSNPETQTIPVVMLSARSQQAEIETGIEAGAVDYVKKPFSPKEVIDKVEEILNKA